MQFINGKVRMLKMNKEVKKKQTSAPSLYTLKQDIFCFWKHHSRRIVLLFVPDVVSMEYCPQMSLYNSVKYRQSILEQDVLTTKYVSLSDSKYISKKYYEKHTIENLKPDKLNELIKRDSQLWFYKAA